MTRHRARRLLLPLAACALAFVTTPAPAVATPADPAPLLLRLPDLGPGYGLSHINRSCAVLRPSLQRLRRALGSRTFRGCLLSFEQVWAPPGAAPGPGGVQSYAFAFDTPAGPTAVLSRPRALPAFDFPRRELRIVEPAPQIGDQAVLMRFDKTILGLHASAGIVAWRSGSVLAMVIAASLTGGDANVRAAVRLATLQQARIANPTPLRPPVNDDRLVPLDDPTLGVPVMWLGEAPPSHGRFPSLHLWATGGSSFFRGYPLVRLIYRTPHLPYAATVALWRPRALHRKLRAPLQGHRCRRRLDGGLPHTTIMAAYVRRHGRCPHDGASFKAVAFFRGVGVTIDVSGRLNPYDSRAGMRTLLRALRPREPRPLPTP